MLGIFDSDGVWFGKGKANGMFFFGDSDTASAEASEEFSLGGLGTTLRFLPLFFTGCALKYSSVKSQSENRELFFIEYVSAPFEEAKHISHFLIFRYSYKQAHAHLST